MKYTVTVIAVISFFAFILVAGCSQIPLLGGSTLPTSENLTVTFINVGQGNSELIEFPNGKVMLIDAGDSHSVSKVITLLTSKNIKQLDYVVATHPDENSVGGLKTIFAQIPVKKFYYNRYSYNTTTYLELISIAKNNRIPSEGIIAKSAIPREGQVFISVLNPMSIDYTGKPDVYALILKIRYGHQSFIFTRDIGSSADQSYNRDNSISVLGLPDHNDMKVDTITSSMRLLPKVFVIEGGTNNPLDIYNPLKKRGAEVYFTSINGDISIVTDGTSLVVIREK
jgi:competence protein ComEC